MKSARRLQLMWPFFGASLAMLESLSFGYNIVTVDEETRLCDKDQVPSDPCESMYVVVEGSLGLVTTSEGSATYKVEIGVSRGAVVGE